MVLSGRKEPLGWMTKSSVTLICRKKMTTITTPNLRSFPKEVNFTFKWNEKGVLPGQEFSSRGQTQTPFHCGSVVVNGNNLHLSGRRKWSLPGSLICTCSWKSLLMTSHGLDCGLWPHLTSVGLGKEDSQFSSKEEMSLAKQQPVSPASFLAADL